MENYLGVKLFQRSTRKVSITAEGEALYQHTRHLLRSSAEGIDEVKNFAEEIKGKIRITATNDFYQCLLMPILKRFHQTYPKVKFDLQITEQALAIIDDSIDLAIRSGELPDSGLVSLPLTTTQLKLYASPEMKRHLPDHPDQLDQYDWVALSIGGQISPLTLTHIAGQQVSVQPHYQHFANSVSSYYLLIEQNFGIGLMTELTADILVSQGKLIPVLPDWYYQTIPISLLYPARLHMARRTRLLIEEIQSALNQSA